MAPKRPTNTGKRKVGETSAPEPPPNNRTFEREQFRSRYHQDRYVALLKQAMWPERVFSINPEGPFREIGQLLIDQGWSRLLNPVTNLNAELVREFYANALPENPHTELFPYETFVRGRVIRFDRDALNQFLGDPFPLRPGDMDDYHIKVNMGTFTLPELFEEVKKFILLEGCNYDVSDAGREFRAQYRALTNPAKIIQKFLLYNVIPNSHLSDCVVEVCPLIYYILKGIKVDIARTLAHELKKITLQGKGERETRLAFPGLIMGLIKDTGMRLPNAVHEQIRNPINDAFISRYIVGETKKNKTKQASTSRTHPPEDHHETAPPQQPEPHDAPASVDPTAVFDFATYAQWQHESNMHTWNMLSATNRANTYFQQSQYVMQQQAGYPPEVMAQFMTLTAFQSYVNWPMDTPNPYGGGGANFAGNMAGDDDAGGDDMERDDDPTQVHSATSTRSGDDGSDDWLR